MIRIVQDIVSRRGDETFGELYRPNQFAEHLLIAWHLGATDGARHQTGKPRQKAQFDGATNDRLQGDIPWKSRSHEIIGLDITGSEHAFPRHQNVVEDGNGVTLVESPAQRSIKL